MRIAIWGAGVTGKRILNEIKTKYTNYNDEILFIDSDKKRDNTYTENHSVHFHAWLKNNTVDILFIGTYTGYKEILNIIENGCYDIRRIDTSYVDLQYNARISFLEQLAPLLSSVEGCVAEVGVYRGEFAQYINQFFPKRLLYLYDTFHGFSEEDLLIEKGLPQFNSGFKEGQLNDTSIDLVMSKMKYPENVKIVQGHFPDSFHEESASFSFVNIDMDLYEPTKKAIMIFYRQLSANGVMLVHDYYNIDCPTIIKAVRDAEAEMKISFLKIPIGDKMSLAIIKK